MFGREDVIAEPERRRRRAEMVAHVEAVAAQEVDRLLALDVSDPSFAELCALVSDQATIFQYRGDWAARCARDGVLSTLIFARALEQPASDAACVDWACATADHRRVPADDIEARTTLACDAMDALWWFQHDCLSP